MLKFICLCFMTALSINMNALPKTTVAVVEPSFSLEQCDVKGYIELAQLTDLNLTLTTEHGIEIQAELKVLPVASKKFDFFVINKIDYSNPKCQSKKIVKAIPLHRDNYILNPNDGQKYASAFIAAKIQYCLLNSTPNCANYIQSLSLSESQKYKFKQADTKNTKTCSPKTIRYLLNSLPESPERLTIIACIALLETAQETFALELKALSKGTADYELVYSKLHDIH